MAKDISSFKIRLYNSWQNQRKSTIYCNSKEPEVFEKCQVKTNNLINYVEVKISRVWYGMV